MTREKVLKVAKPILFNTDMVMAIQDGTKTTTRRVVKPQPPKDAKGTFERMDNGNFQLKIAPYELIYDYEIKPQYEVGDILYVRETWTKGSLNYEKERYYYKADNEIPGCRWEPSIHMPKEAARIFLRVTDVRVERLQDITDEEAEKEGCVDYTSTANGFFSVWDNTVKKSDIDRYGWNANPWVWVFEFERLEVDDKVWAKDTKN